jgi:hypothetical protein
VPRNRVIKRKAEAGFVEWHRIVRDNREDAPDSEPHAVVPLFGLAEWIVEAKFVVREGRPVVKELHVFPSSHADRDIPAKGLTSQDLRAIKLRSRFMEDLIEGMLHDAGVPSGRAVRRPAHTRQARYTDDDVAQDAAEYMTAVEKTKDGNPRRWLTEQKAKRGHWTDSDTAELIRRASRFGYLTAAKGPGDRSPRQATPKLIEWLAQNEPKPRGGKNR